MNRTPKTPHAPEAASEPAPKRYRRHDESYKQLFRDPRAATALIRDFAAKSWADELDMATLQPFPTETVGPDLKRRAGDCAWHVRFKDGRSVVFLFEFQSSADRDMALRMLHYTAAALTTLRNNETLLDPDGALPLVLAFVLHKGRTRGTWPRRCRSGRAGSSCRRPWRRRSLAWRSATATGCLTCYGRSRKTCCRRTA